MCPEIGILFRGDMVRAILAGQKWQTRRAIRFGVAPAPATPPSWSDGTRIKQTIAKPCRFSVGARLWVRETWRPSWNESDGDGAWITYAADEACRWQDAPGGMALEDWFDREAVHASAATPRWRPSIYMPRWASRITLTVIALRSERLTMISEEDVQAEGFPHAGLGSTPTDYCRAYRAMHKLPADADPPVWVVTFTSKFNPEHT